MKKINENKGKMAKLKGKIFFYVDCSFFFLQRYVGRKALDGDRRRKVDASDNGKVETKGSARIRSKKKKNDASTA